MSWGDTGGADAWSLPRDTVVQASQPRGALLTEDPGQRDRKTRHGAKRDVLVLDFSPDLRDGDSGGHPPGFLFHGRPPARKAPAPKVRDSSAACSGAG